MRTYAENTHWKRYQPFFPERARVTDDNAPTEEAWPWRDATIHLDRYERPDARVKVILLHGAGANGRIMGAFGTLLQRYGYACVAPDLPGYGMTDAPSVMMTQDAWVQVVADLVDAEVARDGLPVVLFGASLGGMLAYQVACRNPVVSGVIATTLANPADPETGALLAKHPLMAQVGRVVLNLLSRVLDPIRVPIRWLTKMNHISNDPEMVAALVADRSAAGSVVPLRFLRTLMSTPPDIAPEDFQCCPVLLAHPQEDGMTPIEMSEAFYERLAAPKRYVILEGAGHMPLEQPGIDQLEEAVLSFLGDVVPAAEKSEQSNATAGILARDLMGHAVRGDGAPTGL